MIILYSKVCFYQLNTVIRNLGAVKLLYGGTSKVGLEEGSSTVLQFLHQLPETGKLQPLLTLPDNIQKPAEMEEFCDGRLGSVTLQEAFDRLRKP